MNKVALEAIGYYLMCMNVLPACMSVYYMYVWCPLMPEKSTRCPGTGVTDAYAQPHGHNL